MLTNALGLARAIPGPSSSASSKRLSPRYVIFNSGPTNSLQVGSTAHPRCVTCPTWASQHGGTRLTQSRHNNLPRIRLLSNHGLYPLLSSPQHHNRQRKQKPRLRLTPVTLLVVGLILSGKSGGGVFLLLLLSLFLDCLHPSNSNFTMSFSLVLETCRRRPICVIFFSQPTLVSSSTLLGVLVT